MNRIDEEEEDDDDNTDTLAIASPGKKTIIYSCV
jgi:hypothetical protein